MSSRGAGELEGERRVERERERERERGREREEKCGAGLHYVNIFEAAQNPMQPLSYVVVYKAVAVRVDVSATPQISTGNITEIGKR